MLTPEQVTAARQRLGITTAQPTGGPAAAPSVDRASELDAAWGASSAAIPGVATNNIKKIPGTAVAADVTDRNTVLGDYAKGVGGQYQQAASDITKNIATGAEQYPTEPQGRVAARVGLRTAGDFAK